MKFKSMQNDESLIADAARRHWLQAAAGALTLAALGSLSSFGCSRDAPAPASPGAGADAGKAAVPPALTSGGSATAPAPAPSAMLQKGDIRAFGMLLPGLVDSAEKGQFIELWKAIDAAYAEGKIHFEAYPVGRVYDSVPQGEADIGFPVMKLAEGADAKLPYRFSTEALGKVSFVLYSNKAHSLTRQDIIDAAKAGRPYSVEAPPFDWGVPIQQFTTFESALKKIESGRLDALLWAQEEVDSVIRRLSLKNIQRNHYGDYEDVFILPRTPRGDEVDATLTRVIRAMRADGSLAKAYGKVHLPYDDWQP